MSLISNQQSRKQSSSSTVSLEEDDPLLKDCIGLRQRLLDTEKSLHNLTISTATPRVSPNNSLRNSRPDLVEKSILSDHAPVLTLADLTPSGSIGDAADEMEKYEEVGCFYNRQYSSLGEIGKYKDFDGFKAPTLISSLTNGRHHEEMNNYRHKMVTLRQENSKLFIQNTKLMTELESTTYKLQDSQAQLQQMNIAVIENREIKGLSVGKIKEMEEQLTKKTHIIQQLEKIVSELRSHINDQNVQNKEKKERFADEIQIKENEIQNLQTKLRLLSKKNEDQKKEIEVKETNNNEKLLSLHKDRAEFQAEADTLKEEIFMLQEQLTKVKSKTIELQNVAIDLSGARSENSRLKSMIEKQQEKIAEYDQEMLIHKDHVDELESVIQKIQDEKITPHQNSGILSNSDVMENSHSSPRSIIADLKLKLAMKDTEMHRLKAIVANNSMLQQKLKSDFDFEGVGLKGLRSELSSVIERSRKGDIKQLELEHTITRLQEDVSCKTTQLLELNERLNDKTHLVENLQLKYEQKDSKLSAYHKELSTKERRYEQMEEQFQESIKSLSASLSHSKKSLGEKEKQLLESKKLVESYHSQTQHLENALAMHTEETNATDALVSKIKTLHSEHCDGLEKEILSWRRSCDDKSKSNLKLKKKLEGMASEMQALKESNGDLKDFIKKMEELDEEKKNVIRTYEERLKLIQDKADLDSTKLKNQLDQCKNQLQKTIEEFQQCKVEHSNLDQAKSEAIACLTEDVNVKIKHIHEMENSYNEALGMLQQSQKRISTLEESVSSRTDEISSERLSKEELKQEVEVLHQKICDQQKDIELYQSQVNTMNDALEEAKNKFKEVGETLRNRDTKLLHSAKQNQQLTEKLEIMKVRETKLCNQINDMKTNSIDLENRFLNSESEIEKYKKEIHKESTERQLLESQLIQGREKLKGYETSLQMVENTKIKSNEKFEHIQRLLSASRGESIDKDKELNKCRMRIHEMEDVISEQKWKMKQKSALYTQLEMSCKHEKSELEKRISLAQGEVEVLKDLTRRQENQTEDITSKYKELRSNYDEKCLLCEEYRSQLRLQEEANINASSEVKLLKEELNRLISKIHQKSANDNEVSVIKEQCLTMNMDVQNLQNQLMASQQIIINLTNELDEAHALLAHKESDCTRLARELGGSQVREAQEKSRLNQELRQTVQEHDLKFSQKLEEMDSLRDKNDDLVTTQQQDIMKLRLKLQRSEDEARLARNDLDRRKDTVKELEDSLKVLMRDFHEQQQKCKELEELLVIRESEITRHSARASGLEREMFTTRGRDSSQQTGSQNILTNTKYDGDIHQTNDTLISSLKVHHELNKLRSQTSQRRTSLEDLLKRTEAELKDLNVTEVSGFVDDNVSVLSGVSNLSSNYQ